jgi:hypothetical protein
MQPVFGTNALRYASYQLLGRSWLIDYDYRVLCLPDTCIGLTADVTNRRDASLRHLITLLECPLNLGSKFPQL